MDVRLCLGSMKKFGMMIFVWKGWMRGQRGCVVMDVGRGRKEECVRSGLAKIIVMEIRLGLLDPVPTCGGLVSPAPNSEPSVLDVEGWEMSETTLCMTDCNGCGHSCLRRSDEQKAVIMINRCYIVQFKSHSWRLCEGIREHVRWKTWKKTVFFEEEKKDQYSRWIGQDNYDFGHVVGGRDG